MVQSVLLYDGLCGLCSATVRFTLQHERAATIRFVAIQSGAGQTLAQAHGMDVNNPESFLLIEGGRGFAKADGVIALARHLKGPARLIGLGRLVPRSIRNWLYDRIARNRYRIFGKRSACLIPDPAISHRFTLV
jgi:predicted DCC family thiol-disulfide oxidoreductase YuxK